MTTMTINNEKNGIELKFDKKPISRHAGRIEAERIPLAQPEKTLVRQDHTRTPRAGTPDFKSGKLRR